MTDQPTLQEVVDELTLPVIHREHYQIGRANSDGTTTWLGQDHVTTHPPLIVQLLLACHQAAQTDEGGRPGYTSKPTARLDAIDTVMQIEVDALRWLRTLGKKDPGTVVRSVRLLASLVPSLDEPTVKAVDRDLRRWWAWTRILTGWDDPAWRPDATCPLCGKRGGLRVRMAKKVGMCVDCKETWDEATIGLLADHIRAESAAHEAKQPARPVCWCVWPQLPEAVYLDRFALCRACGSRACVRALGDTQTSEAC